jgi:acyl-CoA thioester hydrolase
MVSADLEWDYPEPHVIEHIALEEEADGYGHVNNSVYLQWLDQCVWDHCDAVEMSPRLCRELNRGFAATRHEIDYLRAAYPGSDGQILLRARSYYVCTDLTTGRPTRMPEIFKTGFKVLPNVARALE